MLGQSLVHDVLTAALSGGGDFAELFVEANQKNNLSMVNGVVEHALSGMDYGAGIRIFYGTNAIYAYTNDTSRDNLIQVAKEAAQAAKGSGGASVLPFMRQARMNMHPVRIPFDKGDKKKAVEMLRVGSDAAFAYSGLISQTQCSYSDISQNIFVANSEGLWAEDQRNRIRLGITAVASSASEKQTEGYHPGVSGGFEFLDTQDTKAMGRNAAEIAAKMLNADLCPSGKMPVVIDGGFGGVIFHEACGHSLEATAIAKGASVFCGKMGQIIANEKVTALDDGTIPGAWGSINIDDEGAPGQKNTLITNGVLTSYLVDKLNGLKMGMPSTGSGLRESYRYAPTSRMTNTYIAAGHDSIGDILASVDYGLYAKKMGGGSVQPSTGEFNFAVLEGYMIRNGKIAEPVRGATLIGKGSQVLMDIDMVSEEVSHDQGMCGSVSGSVPTNVGQPLLRVKSITVGGRR